MSPANLIFDLHRKGIRLTGVGGNLVIEGPIHLITNDVWKAIKSHKPQLLPLVTPRWSQKASTLLSRIDDARERSNLRYVYEERAAIHQHDGGLPEDEAERLAFEYTRQLLEDLK